MVLSPGLWFCLVPGGTTHSSAPPPARAALGAAVRMREDCPLYSTLSSTWTTLGKLQAAFRGRKEHLCHRCLCPPKGSSLMGLSPFVTTPFHLP